MNNTIKQIESMENKLSLGEKDLDQALASLEKIEERLGDYQALFAYYQSPKWQQHLELDETGQLPQDLSRGVLSEDGIYNLLASYVSLADYLKEVSDKMTEQLTALKERD